MAWTGKFPKIKGGKGRKKVKRIGPSKQAFERASSKASFKREPQSKPTVRGTTSSPKTKVTGTSTRNSGKFVHPLRGGPSPAPTTHKIHPSQILPTVVDSRTGSGVKEAVMSVGAINTATPGRIPVGTHIGKPSSGSPIQKMHGKSAPASKSASAPGQVKKRLGLQSARTLAPGAKAPTHVMKPKPVKALHGKSRIKGG